MNLTLFYLDNRLIIDSIYTFIVVATCLIIHFKTLKVYMATKYDGIKYFFMGFLYYAIGFLAIYLANWKKIFEIFSIQIIWTYLPILMEYFLIMGGFYITYSLLWKKFCDIDKEHIIGRVAILHIIALIISLLDFYYVNSYMMYIIELSIGIYAAFIIYHNYMENKSHKFTQFYFISMVCNVVGWAMYFIIFMTHNYYPIIMLYTYIITASAFILLLYGVLRVKQKNGKET